MTKEKQYFIHLLFSFVNNKAPNACEDIDWIQIYKLADIHDVQGIIAQQLKYLPENSKPTNNIGSMFKQALGRTIQNFAYKEIAKNEIESYLSENEIDHIFVKGSVIRQYYPIPELRTSGDIDIIVRENQYDNVVESLKKQYRLVRYHYDTSTFLINDTKIEIHRDSDVYTDYFNDIFSLASNDGYLYQLNEYDTLIYIICHLIKHIKYQGAGIRMLVDIDVMIRAIDDFDLKFLLEKIDNYGIHNSVILLISVTKAWLQTPIENEMLITVDENVIDMFDKIVLDGGSFGFAINNLGTHYLAENIDNGNKTLAKLKTVIKLVFPSPEYVRKYYSYSVKYKFLTPIAYLNRIFDAIFKRTSHSKSTFNQIVSSNEISKIQSNLIKELDL